MLLHPPHQALIDLTEHQRTDLVARLIEGLRGDLTDRVGAIAQVPEELIEFRLDGGMNAGEQKTDDGGQRQGTAAGEVFGVKTSNFQELLGKQILGELSKYFGIFTPSCDSPLETTSYGVIMEHEYRQHKGDRGLCEYAKLRGLYDYLVDVLQRVARHPAAEVALLTPRLWKQHFAPHPLRSDLYRIRR